MNGMRNPAEPRDLSRVNRSGIVLGEGAWLYVLEELEPPMLVTQRSMPEITGYGATCDAYHRVRLEEGGDEPARACGWHGRMRPRAGRR